MIPAAHPEGFPAQRIPWQADVLGTRCGRVAMQHVVPAVMPAKVGSGPSKARSLSFAFDIRRCSQHGGTCCAAQALPSGRNSEQ